MFNTVNQHMNQAVLIIALHYEVRCIHPTHCMYDLNSMHHRWHSYSIQWREDVIALLGLARLCLDRQVNMEDTGATELGLLHTLPARPVIIFFMNLGVHKTHQRRYFKPGGLWMGTELQISKPNSSLIHPNTEPKFNLLCTLESMGECDSPSKKL